MSNETDFRFSGLRQLVAQSRDAASRAQLSKLELGFCAASDFSTDHATEGYFHPFIYRAAQVPDLIWFLNYIGATETAQPIKETFLALQSELGEPKPDDYGDAVFEIAESSPEWETRFATWDESYSTHSDWAKVFEAFLRERGVDPHAFWKR